MSKNDVARAIYNGSEALLIKPNKDIGSPTALSPKTGNKNPTTWHCLTQRGELLGVGCPYDRPHGAIA